MEAEWTYPTNENSCVQFPHEIHHFETEPSFRKKLHGLQSSVSVGVSGSAAKPKNQRPDAWTMSTDETKKPAAYWYEGATIDNPNYHELSWMIAIWGTPLIRQVGVYQLWVDTHTHKHVISPIEIGIRPPVNVGNGFWRNMKYIGC